MKQLTEILAECPLVAILRGVQPGEVVAIGEALFDAGIRVLEVPLNSPEPLESIHRLSGRCGDRMLVGAGTVLHVEDVQLVANAGGRLAVMPNAESDVVREAKRLGLLAIPGIFTPTEAFAMLRAGADALKFFPADAVSTNFLSSLRAVLPPGVLVLPVGGIHAGNLAVWQVAGASGFGIGSALYKPGMTPEEVGRRAVEFMEAIAGTGAKG